MFIFPVPLIGMGIVSIDADTQAWVDAVFAVDGTVVSGPQITLIDNLIVGLKADGLFAKLDRLWPFAIENQTEALVDIVADSLATAVNTPTFTANSGFTGDGSTSYINSNFNPSTAGGNYTQNSASIFGWNNTSGYGSDPDWGDTYDGSIDMFCGFSGSGNILWKMNTTTSRNAVASSGATGLYCAVRTASNSATVDLNGSLLDSTTDASTALPNSALRCLAGSGGATGFSNRQFSCFGFGGGLSSGERSALYSRLRTYMTAVGVP